ncbi:uncharacterized protein LOC109605075 [Aethina tumida]|uniref:uncharacterized protein LOC109605075 n=1 Tax=Aethina tumida TaxID=116153 RepID=UPI002148B5F6|nr:uncharacterized protein LOC109605075 [Aethina tumida]
MNKYAILVFALVLGITAAGLIKPISDEDKQKVREAHEKCQTDPATAVPKGSLKLIQEGKASEVKNLRPHILCMAKIANVIKEDGKLNTDLLRSKWAEHYDAADMAKLQACLVDKDTPEETAVSLVKCQREAVGSILYQL